MGVKCYDSSEVIFMPKSEKQQEAADKYLRERVDTFVTRVPKGKKEMVQAHAATMQESLNGFVNRAIDSQIERDNLPLSSASGLQLTAEEQAHIEKRRTVLAQANS